MERLACLLALIPVTIWACSAGSDYAYIQNPTFRFNVSPPVSWTYFPVTPADAGATTWFFVGQSNNSAQASMSAQADLKAAMIQALVETQLPVNNVNISSWFTPVQIIAPLGTAATGLGPLYGKVEANAVTQVSVGGTGVTAFIWQPFSQEVSITLTNIGTTMYNWNIVKNTFMQQLQLYFYARFATDITITGQSSG